MRSTSAALPEPTADERAHHERLARLIRDEIDTHGAIDFERYMALALYAPGLGYYAAGKTKFGAAGDFVTAPELGSVYARCIAQAVAPVLRATRGDFVELGAGSGAFAADVLVALERHDAVPQRYRILETSADLRERQRERLQSHAPQHLARVEWLDAPPEAAWSGVLFANEVIDALPVQRFEARAGGELAIEQVWCDADGNFVRTYRAASDSERAAVDKLEAAAAEPWPRPYRSERLPALEPWMRSVAGTLECGAALFVDYGYPRRELYLAQRRDGTLVCHYRHRAHGDALVLAGLQDITAFVDFTAVAEAGVDLGLEFGAYLPQSALLLASGLPELLADSATLSDLERYKLTAEIKRLTLPGEMGERFQAIAFTRGLPRDILPFAALDQSVRL